MTAAGTEECLTSRKMFSPEFRLLLLSCRLVNGEGAVEEACEIIRGNRIDWQDLSRRATFHRVEPQLSTLLEKLPLSVAVPASVVDALKESVQANLVGQIRYVAEFFRIEEWLRAADITVIPFKGFWLGESTYGNLADRISSDIDLFISYGDLNEVRRIMSDQGYTGHESLEELTDEYIQGELAEYNFDRYEDGVCQSHVEFHWRSTMSFYRMGITLDDLRSQIITGVLQGRELKVFSPAANLLLVVMHHGGKECFWQLRQVLDFSWIVKRFPDLDWVWLLRQADRFHVTTLLLLGVRLAHEVTGVEVPAAFGVVLAKRSKGKMTGTGRNGAMGQRRIDRLSAGRLRLMAKPVDELAEYKDRLSAWIFKILSRDGIGTKYHLLKYALRKIVAPRFVPGRWRHLFFNRKIRRIPVVTSGE